MGFGGGLKPLVGGSSPPSPPLATGLRHQLWGTGAHARLELRMYTNLAISVHISPVGSGRLVVDTTHFHVPATDSQSLKLA